MAVQKAVFFDPKDPRIGVISQAFLAVEAQGRMNPRDQSWTSWGRALLTPSGTPLATRARTAWMLWWSRTGAAELSNPQEVLTLALLVADQFGIRDDFLAALQERTSPALAEQLAMAGEQTYYEWLWDATGADDADARIKAFIEALRGAKQKMNIAVGVSVFLAAALVVYAATRD